MGNKPNDKTIPSKKGGTDRKQRLAEQLRANLQKRKAQSRSRRTGGADQRPDGLGASKDGQRIEPHQPLLVQGVENPIS
ncbi:hypothetical protein [Mesorhizobium sp.]|uniref:hypothetical protein n=1 Tax=Mesorhizobium sp. TaxID=1871066 RepID=UPI0025CE65A1|nr:hypothetical protein [Mesorhizobium sp.]